MHSLKREEGPTMGVPAVRALQPAVYHFVGIGGYGMSGLARILAEAGFRVSGSDVRPSSRTQQLAELGVAVYIGHQPVHVEGADIVVRSTDVPDDNPELAEARRRGLEVWHRSEVLARLLNPNRGIAVTGTHGKTTTASMVAGVLLDAGLDPTVSVGGEVDRWQGTGRLGTGEWVVAEACESDGSFLRYRPQIAVVTNLEPEHLDRYDGSFSALRDAFTRFLAGVKDEGVAVLCADDEQLRQIRTAVRADVITYGLAGPADLVAADPVHRGRGWSFDVVHGGRRLGRINLGVPGLHNVANALAATAVALAAGVPFDVIAGSLEAFRGAHRRFEIVANGSVMVVDDYAHHPTEIRATLRTAREQARGRVIAVFQPQRYSRTRYLWHEFAGAFDQADEVVLTEIYAPPGERPIPGVSGRALADEVRRRSGASVHFVPSRQQVADVVLSLVRDGDVVVTMGAGDIWQAAYELAERLGTPTT